MQAHSKQTERCAVDFSNQSPLTILDQLEQSHHLSEVFQGLSYTGPSFFKIKLPIPIENLQQAYLNSLKDVALAPWRTKSGPVEIYLGYSLTYNPQLQDDVDSIYSSLGTDKVEQFFSVNRGSGDVKELKNSYYDTYAFRKTHPLIRKHYSELLDRLNFNLTRSRLSVARPKAGEEMKPTAGWHIDEHIYQNLRVNIPVFTGPDYFIEIEGTDDWGRSLSVKEHLELGFAYVWNTRVPHRVAFTGSPNYDRVHLVLGLMPWFRYDEEKDMLFKNDFFGIHPFEAVIQGKIFK